MLSDQDRAAACEQIARLTSGFSGAELANVVNEAALLTGRDGRKVSLSGKVLVYATLQLVCLLVMDKATLQRSQQACFSRIEHMNDHISLHEKSSAFFLYIVACK